MPLSPSPSPHLRAAQQGDAAAFCALMREHEAPLLRQAQGLCRDAALAEDLVQETLAEAWRALPGFRGQARLSTWLYTILLNRHRKALRAAKIRPYFCLSAEERDRALEHLQALSAPPDQDLADKESAARLLALVHRLPAKQREVIRLRFYADASLEEIAAVLGCAVGTVKSRLFHALEKLRAWHKF